MSLALIAVLLMNQASPSLQTPPFDPAARVHEAVEIAKSHAYRSTSVDWKTLEAEMLSLSQGAMETADMLPAYAALTHRLGDGHSFVQPPSAVMTAWHERHGDRDFNNASTTEREITSTFYSRSDVEHQDLNLESGRTVRVVVVPAFKGNARGLPAEAYATEVFTALADAPSTTCAYIIDLRGNVGGNFWPIMIGLSPLLGDGLQGLSRGPTGRDSAFARLERGQAISTEGDTQGSIMSHMPAWRPIPRLTTAPTAVLVDDATASSGEGVALAFVGRADTRSFGVRTYGVASANKDFVLSDGVKLVLTVSMMVDPLGQTHPAGYTPDVIADASPQQPLDAAQTWLGSLTKCKAESASPLH